MQSRTWGLLTLVLWGCTPPEPMTAVTVAPSSSAPPAVAPSSSAPPTVAPSPSPPPPSAAPEHPSMNYEFRVTQTPEHQLMAVHDQARGGELPTKIRQGLGKVYAYLKAQGKKGDHNVVVYREYDRAAGVMTIDIGVQVDTPLVGDGTVVPVTTPGGLVATTVHLGPYEKLGDASSALLKFCAEHGHPVVGPTWEDYDHWNDDPTKLRTDVFALIGR